MLTREATRSFPSLLKQYESVVGLSEALGWKLRFPSRKRSTEIFGLEESHETHAFDVRVLVPTIDSTARTFDELSGVMGRNPHLRRFPELRSDPEYLRLAGGADHPPGLRVETVRLRRETPKTTVGSVRRGAAAEVLSLLALAPEWCAEHLVSYSYLWLPGYQVCLPGHPIREAWSYAPVVHPWIMKAGPGDLDVPFLDVFTARGGHLPDAILPVRVGRSTEIR